LQISNKNQTKSAGRLCHLFDDTLAAKYGHDLCSDNNKNREKLYVTLFNDKLVAKTEQ